MDQERQERLAKLDNDRLDYIERYADLHYRCLSSQTDTAMLLQETVAEIRRFRKLKIYSEDHGWAGAVVVIASSEEIARSKTGGYCGHGEFSKGPLKGEEIVDGWNLICLGDA